MPKIAYDFSKEMLFYIIKCKDELVEEVYIGSTFNFTNRKYQHKSSCNNEKNQHYNCKKYQYIREHGGWNNFSIYVIDRKICIDKLDAIQHEQSLIELHKAKLNSIRAFTDKEERKKQNKIHNAEYNATHKEETQKYNAEYIATHKEEIKQRSVEYRATHKEKIKQQKAEYRATHKEEIKQRSAKYRLKKKETQVLP